MPRISHAAFSLPGARGKLGTITARLIFYLLQPISSLRDLGGRPHSLSIWNSTKPKLQLIAAPVGMCRKAPEARGHFLPLPSNFFVCLRRKTRKQSYLTIHSNLQHPLLLCFIFHRISGPEKASLDSDRCAIARRIVCVAPIYGHLCLSYPGYLGLWWLPSHSPHFPPTSILPIPLSSSIAFWCYSSKYPYPLSILHSYELLSAQPSFCFLVPYWIAAPSFRKQLLFKISPYLELSPRPGSPPLILLLPLLLLWQWHTLLLISYNLPRRLKQRC